MHVSIILMLMCVPVVVLWMVDMQEALQRDNSLLSNTVRRLNRDVAKVIGRILLLI